MRGSMKKLLEIIEKEVGVQQKILEKLEEQQAVLVKLATEKLEENLEELEKWRCEAKAIFEKRIALQQNLGTGAKHKGGLKTVPTLSEIACTGDEKADKALSRHRDKLIRTVKKIRSQSRKNQVLIRHSLDLNTELMNKAFGTDRERVSTYGNSGELLARSSVDMVDARA